MRVKDIYNCEPINKDVLLPLEKWYNQIIEKQVSDIELKDVLRMLRQNLFVEIAIKKSMELLTHDPIIGEMYDGELLEKISEENSKYYLNYKEKMLEILDEALHSVNQHEWIGNKEKNEYYSLLQKIKKEIMK